MGGIEVDDVCGESEGAGGVFLGCHEGAEVGYCWVSMLV